MSRNTDKFIVAFIMFSLYLSAGTKNDPSNMQNIVALLFMASLSPAFGAVTQLPLLVMTRALYIREMSDGCFLTITYVLWKVLEELAMCAFSASLFTGTVFFSIGFQVRCWESGAARGRRCSPSGLCLLFFIMGPLLRACSFNPRGSCPFPFLFSPFLRKGNFGVMWLTYYMLLLCGSVRSWEDGVE